MEGSTLKILPCCPALLGSQQCLVGPAVIGHLQAKLASPVCITVGQTVVLCRLWPREDTSSTYVELDQTVYSPMGESLDASHSSSISVSDMKVLSDGPVLDAVSVTVIVSDHRYAARLRHCASLRNQLHIHVKNVLRDLIISDGYTICCDHIPAAKLYGLHKLLISSATPSGSIGVLGRRTRLLLATTISAARYNKRIPRRLAGLQLASAKLENFLINRFRHCQRLKAAGITPPVAVLMHGPSGCGKTTIVHAVASTLDVHVIRVTSQTSTRPGDEEQRLRLLFSDAREMATEGPCLLFLDDLDAVCGSGREGKRVLAQLVILLDELQQTANLAVVGATSRLAAVQPALRRAGRFENEIFIGMPTVSERQEILKSLTSKLCLSPDVSISELAEATPGFVGADLEVLVQQAFYTALAELNSVAEVSITLHNRHLQAALHVAVPCSQRGSDCLVERTPVSWQNIGGLEEVKLALRQAVEWPLKHAAAFRRLGLPRPRGVLLHGPPGCAKTTLVRAAAGAAHVTFLAVSGAQLYSPCVGDSEKKIAQVFQQARAGAPCILFIDEIDSVVGTRGQGSGQRSVQERVLTTLLNEMDGIGLRMDDCSAVGRTGQQQQLLEGEGHDGGTTDTTATVETTVDNRDVLVVAATNRPDMLDAALLRPGRMDRIIYVPMPDVQTRQAILQVHMQKGRDVDWDVDVDGLVRRTGGFTGADLENLCREAALHALSVDGLDVSVVRQRHFDHVLQTLKPSHSKQQLLQYAPLKSFSL